MLFFRTTLTKIELFFLSIMFCALLCMESPVEMVTAQSSYHVLADITASIHNLFDRANALIPEKSLPSSKQELYIWEKENYSVIQVHVLDQFLTAEQLSKQMCPLKNIPDLSKIFESKEKTNITINTGNTINKCSCDTQEIEAIQKINRKIQNSEINPNLNIGGGEESCGYHAIKNAILLSQNLETDPLVYLTFNDFLYANKLFGTATINTLFNGNPAEEGPWRRKVVDHRMALNESSLALTVKIAHKALKSINENLEKLPPLIETFKKSPDENINVKIEIEKIWENILSQESKAALEANVAKQKSTEIGTSQAESVALETSQIAAKANELLQNAKNIMPIEMVTSNLKSTDDDNYYDPDGYNEYDLDDYEDEEEEDVYVNEEPEDSDKENNEVKRKSDNILLNLAQSEKEGNNLDVSDLDYLYDWLKESNALPESTIVGAADLGVEPLEDQESADEELAKIIFDRITTEFAKNNSHQHIVFIGGGGHWATLVIRIINNRLYYIIADSTNEQRYDVDLKRKGIFITKAIQKIIDGTKDSLLKLIASS